MVRALPALLLLSACGLGGGGGELTIQSFPQSGLAPFRLLREDETADAPYLLRAPGLDLDEPAGLVDGDTLRLFVTVAPRGPRPTDPTYLAQAQVKSLAAGAGELEPVLQPDQPWEGGRLRSPTVLADLPGMPRFLLLYLGQDGSLGLARSPDGSAWHKAAAPLIPAAQVGGALHSASAVVDGGRLLIYTLSGEPPQLLLLEADLAAGLTPPLALSRTALPLSPADLAVPVSGLEQVPAERILSVRARHSLTPAGRPRFDLYLVAEARGRRAICAAASYDGRRFLPVAHALLQRVTDPSAPAVVAWGPRAGRPLMLVAVTGVHRAVAGAIIP